MVLPTMKIMCISAPAICTSFPRLIIRPAAGITAITAIKTLPSFWRKSKLILIFLPSFFSSESFFPAEDGLPEAAEDSFGADAVFVLSVVS